MELKERFIEIYKENIKREGAEVLLDWLINKSDFFTAPASGRFHCAYEGGLVEHSLNVFDVLAEKHYDDTDDTETFAICGLLHDVCKANYYKVSTRNVKNEATGVWEKQPYYMVEDKFPYGHGEKSVFIIERFMKLKSAEAMAIRWHMGGFDDSVKGGSFSLSAAFEKYPLAVKLHLADLEASYLVEKR